MTAVVPESERGRYELVVAGEVLERVPTPGGRVRRAHRFNSAVDLGLDQGRVLQQSKHSGRHELVDLREADAPVLTGAPFGPAVAEQR